MYLRSTILSLLVVINMGAVNQAGICFGAAQLAIGAPFLYWLSTKSEQTSRNSSDQAWESRQKLQKMGAKVKISPWLLRIVL